MWRDKPLPGHSCHSLRRYYVCVEDDTNHVKGDPMNKYYSALVFTHE